MNHDGQENPSTTDRVHGLDSIRFVCALWVFFGHGAAPTFFNPFPEGTAAYLALRGIYGNIWVGPAAVIVFFVISGFCIHFPFAASDRQPRLKEFYARRFLRILLPVLAAVPIGRAADVHLTLFKDSILWSLLAELIYYVLYPALRAAQLRRGSWFGIVTVSFFAALAVAATNYSAGNYPSYGGGLNWLLGLPCWLFGVVLAEFVRTRPMQPVSTSAIWSWRGTIFATAWICSALRFHSPVGFPWTLNFFAALVGCWLYREIHFRHRVAPPRLLEWAGLWSYSLYLMHLPARALWTRYSSSLPAGVPGWALMVLFVLAACYLFYVLVERPSHIIAKKVAQRLQPAGYVAVATTASGDPASTA